MIEIRVENLAKRFGPRAVFSGISFAVRSGESLAVTGRNGSGKTTLLRILSGLIRSTSGTVTIACDGRPLDPGRRRRQLAYVGPELALYDQLTAWENLAFFMTLRGRRADREWLESLLEAVQLSERRDDRHADFSSGMKQRLKYAVALVAEPDILLLDEPTANLDDPGKELVRNIIARQNEKGIVILATNEPADWRFAQKQLRLDG